MWIGNLALETTICKHEDKKKKKKPKRLLMVMIFMHVDWKAHSGNGL